MSQLTQKWDMLIVNNYLKIMSKNQLFRPNLEKKQILIK
mgnify:CR=1 FL=1